MRIDKDNALSVKQGEAEIHNTLQDNDNTSNTLIQFTIFKSDTPLSKQYQLVNGVIHKQAAACMTHGVAHRIELPINRLPELFKSADAYTAFGYGVHDAEYPDFVDIRVSGKDFPSNNVLARTKSYYQYPNSPGIMMIDHDPNDYGQSLTPTDLLAVLHDINPALTTSTRIVRGSVSSGVHIDGEPKKNGKGYHIYIPVANASDIPRYGKVLFDRLWLAGYGYIALAANGGKLIRSPIDAAVFSPERLDFVGHPIILNNGLTYTPPDIAIIDGGMLDTKSLPGLTHNEEQQVRKLQKLACAAISHEADAKQRAWANSRIDDMVEKGYSPDIAKSAVDKIINGEFKTLPSDWILSFASGMEISVAYVLANPQSFDGKSLADPIEGINYGKTTAKFYWNNGDNPCIHSNAHGGVLYYSQGRKDELTRHVEYLNRTHAKTVVGGKHKVMRFNNDSGSSERQDDYELFSLNELVLLHSHKKIKVGEKNVKGQVINITKNEILAWSEHPNVRSYPGGVIFSPSKEVSNEYFNTWRGFSVAPIEGDWSLIKYHIESIICSGNAELIDYFYNWTAYTFQNPDKPAGSALVCRGDKGSGKGLMGHFLRRLWGKHGLHITSSKHLVGDFNAQLSNTCFLFADEAFYSGDKQHENVLKGLITEPIFTIERKGVDATCQNNFLKIFMATNSEYAVPASRDERRYCVFDVSSDRIGDTNYFNNLRESMENTDVQSAFFYAMLNRNLDGFHTGHIPDSIGLRAQRLHSLNSAGKWLIDCLGRGSFYKTDTETAYFPGVMSSSKMHDLYIGWCRDQGISEHRRYTQKAFSMYLKKMYKQKRDSAGRMMFCLGDVDDALLCFCRYERLDSIGT